jgi:hypothetical protein
MHSKRARLERKKSEDGSNEKNKRRERTEEAATTEAGRATAMAEGHKQSNRSKEAAA